MGSAQSAGETAGGDHATLQFPLALTAPAGRVGLSVAVGSREQFGDLQAESVGKAAAMTPRERLRRPRVGAVRVDAVNEVLTRRWWTTCCSASRGERMLVSAVEEHGGAEGLTARLEAGTSNAVK